MLNGVRDREWSGVKQKEREELRLIRHDCANLFFIHIEHRMRLMKRRFLLRPPFQLFLLIVRPPYC